MYHLILLYLQHTWAFIIYYVDIKLLDWLLYVNVLAFT